MTDATATTRPTETTAEGADSARSAPWVDVITSRRRLDLRWLTVVAIMTVPAIVFFGWRAAVSIASATVGAMVAYFLIRGVARAVFRQYRADSILHVLMLGALTGLCLPVLHDRMIPVLAGLAVGSLSHIVGRSHFVRLHPVALVVLVIWFAPALSFSPQPSAAQRTYFDGYQAVLTPRHIITGDVARSQREPPPSLWWHLADPSDDRQAVDRPWLGMRVLHDRSRMIEHEWVLVNMLSSGELPRLEDVLLGAVAGPVGATSRAVLLGLILYLAYRRLARWSVVVYAFIAAMATLMLMVVPLDGRDMLMINRLVELRPAVAVTYVAYLLLSTPLLLVFGILAPITQPVTRWGRSVYGMTLGSLAMAAMWVTGVPAAAFAALVVVSLFSRPLDTLRFSRFAQ